jgi:hypothetical protein
MRLWATPGGDIVEIRQWIGVRCRRTGYRVTIRRRGRVVDRCTTGVLRWSVARSG